VKRYGLGSFLFGFEAPVDRSSYLRWGLGLMVGKFAIDSLALRVFADRTLTPVEYLAPSALLRGTIESTPVVQLLLLAWTLPFIWIGLSMSIRRAIDSGKPASLGICFLLPGLNYVLMLALALAPSRPATPRPLSRSKRSALLGVAYGSVLSVCMAAFSATVLQDYGSSLFFTTPVVLGFVSAWFFNRGEPQSASATFAVASFALLLTSSMLLLFAIEGILCLLMALPLALPLACVGAMFGRFVALTPMPGGSTAAVLIPALGLPLGASFESKTHGRAPLREVVTSIEIAAPPEQVWPHVLDFPELPPPHQLVLLAGIAYPVRAHLEGRGVGAIRRCEFSTGAFVEPITRFEPPHRLSFDVVEQPLPLHEVSPYRDLHPPHLDGYFRSRRGEFRLVALVGGRTRLEGSTSYELDLEPLPYWSVWSDFLLHTIHERVLGHVRALAERTR